MAWNERDAEKRLALVRDALTQEGSYRDPASGVPAVGHQGLADYIGAFWGNAEDYFEPLPWTPADSHHDRLRMPWRLCDARGEVLLIGEDVGSLDPDGRFREITGFFEEPPRAPAEGKACARAESSGWSEIPEIVRGYRDAWTAIGNVGQPINRLFYLNDIWAKDGYYVDPLVEAPVIGRHPLSMHMRHALASWDAGHYFEVSEWSGNDLHHDRLRIRWRHCSPTGAILLQGVDIGEIDSDGLLSRITSFWNSEQARQSDVTSD